MSTDDLTEFDLLQLDRLEQKGEWEGSLTYAVENWPWPFDDPRLDEASRNHDAATLRQAIRASAARRAQWWRDHPHPTQIAPLEAHDAESERRERKAAQ